MSFRSLSSAAWVVGLLGTLPAQELPALEVRDLLEATHRPKHYGHCVVQLPRQWSAEKWAPLVLTFARDSGIDAARAAVTKLGAELPGAGFVVVAFVHDESAKWETARLLRELRRTFRIEQGGLHAAVDGDPVDAEKLLLAHHHEFQTVTAFGERPRIELDAFRRLPARRVHALDTSDPKALAEHFTKLHAERALQGVAGEVARVLDDFHDAAANADAARYFAILRDDAVFLGTDGTERWTGAQFRRDHAKYFTNRPSAWTYVALQRHVDVEPGDQVAWFDETFDNEAYGECRGTGVLAKRDGKWVLRQYHLTVPVPNALARDVAMQIRALQGAVADSTTTIVLVRHAEKASDDPDTELSEAGKQRAEHLARLLRDFPFAAVYSSGYRRTAQTVAPVCSAQGKASTSVSRVEDLVTRLREHRGRCALVCGHSNTIPEIVKALGITEPLKIADHEFDRIFVVTLGTGGPRLTSLRF